MIYIAVAPIPVPLTEKDFNFFSSIGLSFVIFLTFAFLLIISLIFSPYFEKTSLKKIFPYFCGTLYIGGILSVFGIVLQGLLQQMRFGKAILVVLALMIASISAVILYLKMLSKPFLKNLKDRYNYLLLLLIFLIGFIFVLLGKKL